MEIFRSLEQSPVVSDFEVLEFRTWEDGFYYKIKIGIQDGSLLFAREFYNQNERHYSFHWQDARGSLLIRWDDAPHHRLLSTYPYHKHLGESITESLPISLAQVLDEIAQNVLKITLHQLLATRYFSIASHVRHRHSRRKCLIRRVSILLLFRSCLAAVFLDIPKVSIHPTATFGSLLRKFPTLPGSKALPSWGGGDGGAGA